MKSRFFVLQRLFVFLCALVPLQAHAQNGPQHMLPPVGCPTAVGGGEGLLQWRDDGSSSLGCASGITTDGNGDLAVGGTVTIGNNTATHCGNNVGGGALSYTNNTLLYCNGTNWVQIFGGNGGTYTETIEENGVGQQLASGCSGANGATGGCSCPNGTSPVEIATNSVGGHDYGPITVTNTYACEIATGWGASFP